MLLFPCMLYFAALVIMSWVNCSHIYLSCFQVCLSVSSNAKKVLSSRSLIQNGIWCCVMVVGCMGVFVLACTSTTSISIVSMRVAMSPLISLLCVIKKERTRVLLVEHGFSCSEDGGCKRDQLFYVVIGMSFTLMSSKPYPLYVQSPMSIDMVMP